MAVIPRLLVTYREDVLPRLMKDRGFTNVHQVPRLQKISLNMGLGEGSKNIKLLDYGADELTQIAGQKAVITRARRSIAGFKIREGMPIGTRVTLRGPRMYEFFDRLVNVALPRVRDFRGVSTNSFDGRGNYTLGITEQTIFPEIDYEKVDSVKGLSVAIVTSATNDQDGRALLEAMGMPFRKR
jgi:large subunit ribosomal protein L5